MSLGGLPGLPESLARAVSADGTVVVGEAIGGHEYSRRAFVWTATTGMFYPGDLPNGAPTTAAYGVSGDGSIVVGESRAPFAPTPTWQGFRWTSSGGPIGIDNTTDARAASYAGAVIVGSLQNDYGFRWTDAGGTVLVEYGPGWSTLAAGVSADGSVLVGTVGHAAGGPYAYRLVEGSGAPEIIGVLPGSGIVSSATAVSADGEVIVGTSAINAREHHAFRWTDADSGNPDYPGTMVDLGEWLPAGVNGDGSIIVGTQFLPGEPAGQREAVVWTTELGKQPLMDLLLANDVSGLEGWQLYEAHGVSADGNWVVGRAISPASGQPQAFLANITPDNCTTRRPISLVRRSAVKMASPRRPSAASAIATAAKTVKMVDWVMMSAYS